jgi:hypothetical protein
MSGKNSRIAWLVAESAKMWEEIVTHEDKMLAKTLECESLSSEVRILKQKVIEYEAYLTVWRTGGTVGTAAELKAASEKVAELEAQLARAVPVAVVSDSIFASMTTKPKNLGELLEALSDDTRVTSPEPWPWGDDSGAQ